MEASALPAPAGVARTRISLGAPLLRLRSDDQLLELFRAGHDEAFRVIHDRYRQRLFAYTRQMLPGSRQDAEDALQDVFVRAYAGLRANDRQLALRAWLYRVAHNRCVDELRRPLPPAPELIELVRAPVHDPIAQAEQRESLRRLIADVRRLPEQQRSALLMRELSGMSYTELADALGTSIPAVKSLLVRARVGLAQAAEARDTACSEIRDELTLAHGRRMRPNAMARRHLRDCASCREFRIEMRSVSRQLAALVPAFGPAGLLANALGIGGGGGGAAAGGSAAAAGTGGAFAASGLFATGVGHVATLLAAALVTAGGAIEIQNTIVAPAKHHTVRHHARATPGFGTTIGDAAQSSLLALSAQSAESARAAAAQVRKATPAAAPARPVSSSSRPAAAAPPPASAHPVIRHYIRSARPDPNGAAMANGALSSAAAAADSATPPPPDDASSQTGEPSASSSGSSTSTSSASSGADSSSTPAGGASTPTPGATAGTSGSTGSGTSSTGASGASTPSGSSAGTGGGSVATGH